MWNRYIVERIPLITEKHLAVVRAALKFFDEELGPHGNDFEMYLDKEDMRFGVTNSDLKATRDLFSNIVPRQTMLDIDSDLIATHQHFDCADAAMTDTPADRIRYVTLLLQTDWET